MWRSSCNLLKPGLTSAVRGRTTSSLQVIRACLEANEYSYGCLCGARSLAPLSTVSISAATGSCGGGDGKDNGLSGGGANGESITFAEAKRLMRLVNVESLKMKLGMEDKEVIGYSELLEACENMGLAKSVNEAAAFARVLDEAGVILLFRDKVYLHPDK
ncbi:unnamed protein product, partial [Ilex paraguariensis]